MPGLRKIARGGDLPPSEPPGDGAVPVPIGLVRPGFRVRLEGEDAEHVQVLADSADPVPPILVHRQTMRVVDGMHRLLASVRRRADTILVEFFDGSEEDALLLALKRNATHGLPLTPADRAAGVSRVLASRPGWSDRAVAAATGISAKTVAVIRRRSPGTTAQSPTRLGRDGRRRPLDAADGRLRASALIELDPAAPLREVASRAGISLSTAHDVRRRLRTGQDPVPSRQPGSRATIPRPRPPAADPATALGKLRQDPSLRFTEAGRVLLRLLEANALHPGEWDRLADTIPAHWLTEVTALADHYANSWQTLARGLRRRGAAQLTG